MTAIGTYQPTIIASPIKASVTPLELQQAMLGIYRQVMANTRSIYFDRDSYTPLNYRRMMSIAIGSSCEHIDGLKMSIKDWAKSHRQSRSPKLVDPRATANRIEHALLEQCETLQKAIWECRDKNTTVEGRTIDRRIPIIMAGSSAAYAHKITVPRGMFSNEVTNA
ncbi:hypothetical protein ACL1G3_00260 [Corynebacterium striatum]|uniref:hypothetical protein n=1 Tax=Corynebacterium striatum TaxID=43770 RepID=UPI00194E50C4|nr:hypothetical protein [Corynebacterium striatum]QRP19269.1 hypothetical protein I6J27_02285 [Corynebacterium striatum]HAT1137663.1 hypothetical protein [Corynebacterium striatum]HAT1195243.1 hypothetical protein [Corynebacterium striatum]HAT1215542.1 hypothetical protein [Corynebacterium striatum]HAT1248869.1 hypothetical protein [Corynebacterium striatum]